MNATTTPEVNDDGYFDMDILCGLLRERGIDAYTEHTGGGCATIYTGQPKGDYFVLAAGPGTFQHRTQGFHAGSFAEFGYGPDDDECADFTYVDEMPLADLADQMVAKHNEVLAARIGQPNGVPCDDCAAIVGHLPECIHANQIGA